MLRDAGFSVAEEPFEYSAFPGSWATPVFGAAGIAVALATTHLGAHGSPGAALALLASAALAMGIAGRWLARRGVLDAPWMRREGVNLVALRGPEPVRVWLVAHTDTKSQPVPQALRAAGIMVLAAALVAAGALAAVASAGLAGPPFGAWIAAALLAVAGGAPVVASVVGDRSMGALDNASGVAAVLLAAEQLPASVPIGVLVTSAEELGLAGARAWAAAVPIGQIALNCDGVDDVGVLTGMYSGRRPERVLEAFAEAAGRRGHGYRSMRLVPGILVDAVALADAGWQTATLSRGTLRTLGRVHTSRDTLGQLEGHGIPEAAAVLAAAAERLALTGAR